MLRVARVMMAVVLLSGLLAHAGEAPIPTFVDVESAGPDYQVQGEYIGYRLAGGVRTIIAAQVVATGNGSFYALVQNGGLPGAGWDGQPPAVVKGATQDGVTTLRGSGAAGYTLTIRDGVMTGRSPQGDELELKRVERRSPTLGAKPPPGAVVLFDGTSAEEWIGGHIELGNALAAGTRSRRSFRNFTAHIEFMTPFVPTATGEARGNSGVYLQDRYEIQIVDSFAAERMWMGTCGAIYGQKLPDVNMCLPPLVWQTFDFEFETAQFDEQTGQKIRNAIVTVRHNGVVIHNRVEIKDRTGGGRREGPSGGPLQLQGHGNPVFFRNIWVVEK